VFLGIFTYVRRLGVFYDTSGTIYADYLYDVNHPYLLVLYGQLVAY